MKIVHVISSLKVGGAESLLVSLLKQLSLHTGIQQSVIYIHGGPFEKAIQEQGIVCYQVTGRFFTYDPWFFVRLFRLIKKLQPDCIHSSLWAANVASRIIAALLRVPHISALHNNVDQNGTLRNLLDRNTQRFSTTIVAVSEGVAASVSTRDGFIPASLVVIKNGINSREVVAKGLAYGYTRHQWGLTDDCFIIGSVGRLVPLKNYPLLLRSFATLAKKYDHIRLMIVGSGPEKSRLQGMARELGIEQAVLWLEGYSSYGFYPLFDCFCLSSYKEGISMALLEAMSFGRACVVTNPTKAHDVITHDVDGLIVSSGDYEQLVCSIESVINNESLRSRIGDQASLTVNNYYSLERMVKEYYTLYKNSTQ